MVGGFNTNVRYRGRILHVQTEDSGAEHPHVITLLYEGGAILYSKKSSYGDRVSDPDLEATVRELMEGQHREMVRQLKSGNLDRVLGFASAEDGAEVDQRPASGPDGEADFGAGIITDRPIDEVILSHFAAA